MRYNLYIPFIWVGSTMCISFAHGMYCLAPV